LSPIVTAGLPTPGPLAAVVAVVVGWLALVALELLEPVEDDLPACSQRERQRAQREHRRGAPRQRGQPDL
jgi:hypothetical protein